MQKYINNSCNMLFGSIATDIAYYKNDLSTPWAKNFVKYDFFKPDGLIMMQWLNSVDPNSYI